MASPKTPPRVLQWGHGLAAVESGADLHGANLHGALQWGHGLAAVESYLRNLTPKFRILASMGPRPRGRGEQAVKVIGLAENALQWGHGLAAVESGEGMYRTFLEAALQWGHGLAAVESARTASRR